MAAANGKSLVRSKRAWSKGETLWVVTYLVFAWFVEVFNVFDGLDSGCSRVIG